MACAARGACTAPLTIYGAVILLTGRATRGDQRAFRRVQDAGLYYLGNGLAITLLMAGVLLDTHHQPVLAIVALVGALTLGSLAIIRYRPAKGGQR